MRMTIQNYIFRHLHSAILLYWEDGVWFCGCVCLCIYKCNNNNNIYIYIYICLYICLFIFVYLWVCACRYMCMNVFACMHICMYICMYACMCVCVFGLWSIHLSVWVHTPIHIDGETQQDIVEFSCFTLPWCFETGSLSEQKLAILAMMPDQRPLVLHFYLPLMLELLACITMLAFLCGFRRLKLRTFHL
jgi:hypothetical protein